MDFKTALWTYIGCEFYGEELHNLEGAFYLEWITFCRDYELSGNKYEFNKKDLERITIKVVKDYINANLERLKYEKKIIDNKIYLYEVILEDVGKDEVSQEVDTVTEIN